MSKPITLGVFLPESAVYPLLSPNFLAGIELYLREQENEVAGRSVKIVTEHLALNPNRTPEKLQRAISVDRIDFALGCVGAAALSLCRETLEQYQIPMIAATAGASVPKSREMGPFIYRTSLGLWQSNYAMAARAVQQHGPRAELVPIMLDAGYDSNYAVHCGFESRGGKVERWHMADGRDFTLNVDPVIAAVREANPDFIFVNACGPKAVGVVRSFLTSGLLANRPLHGSAFTFEGPNALALGEAAVGMRSAHGWAEGLSHSEHRSFCAAFEDFSQRPAEGFASLGYESARLACDAIRAAGGDCIRKDEMRAALDSAQFTGPRGAMQMDATTRTLAGPIFLRELRPLAGDFGNVFLEELPSLPERDPVMKAAFESETRMWTNPYLCV